MSKRNWLITGGCGFLGRNLIKQLDDEINIRIIDNFSVGKPEDLSYTGKDYDLVTEENLDWNAHKIQIVEGNILNEDLANKVCKSADVVVHFAANTGVGPSVEDPRMDCHNNVIGTFNYLEACRNNKVASFVFASSGAPIGECEPPIHEELACHPVSPYGASKLAGEAYCSAYYRSFGLNTVCLRFGNVYGPGSTHKSSVVAKFIRKILNEEELEIYGDGSQTRDFIYVEDLCRAVKLSASKDVGGEVFQIATNRETTVNELTEQMLTNFEERGYNQIKVSFGPKRVGDVMRNFSDTSKAKQILNWECQFDLSQGLNKTIDWFIKK